MIKVKDSLRKLKRTNKNALDKNHMHLKMQDEVNFGDEKQMKLYSIHKMQNFEEKIRKAHKIKIYEVLIPFHPCNYLHGIKIKVLLLEVFS